MRIILIDNYDSFTFNLYQLFAALGAHVDVIKNDAIKANEVFAMRPTHIIISPGPGSPADAGISNDIIHAYADHTVDVPSGPHKNTSPLPPLLGVCLGHQCIASVFTPTRNPVRHAPVPMHGKTSAIHHDGKGIMKDIPSPFTAARYHSLIVDTLPPAFELMCWTQEKKKPDLIMGMRHQSLPIFGVQFHPESFLTEHGKTMARNFLSQSCA